MFTVVGPDRAGIDPLNQYVLQDKLGRSIWSAVIYSGRQLLADLSWQEDLRALEIRVQSGQPRAGHLGRRMRSSFVSRVRAGLRLLLCALRGQA